MSSKLQADGCYHYQWWRRLVNAYEVEAGVVYLQHKNCVIHARALQRRALILTMRRYTNPSKVNAILV